jgi:hypothetical protein
MTMEDMPKFPRKTLVWETWVAAAAGALCLLAGAPARATPCGDLVAALDARLNQTATSAGSASSGGQAVAASRQGQASEARDQGGQPSGAATPFQSEKPEAQATQRATDAGGGGDRVQQAKASLNRARSLDSENNPSGCMEAVAEAKKHMSD